MEIPQFLRTILLIYSRIVIREPPLPHILLEDLLEGSKPSAPPAVESTSFWNSRCATAVDCARCRFGVRDGRGIAACALCPWTRTAIAYTFRRTTEAGSSGGELERLEES